MGHARHDAVVVHGAACPTHDKPVKKRTRPSAPELERHKPSAAEAKAALLELAYAAPEGHPMRDRILGLAAGVFLTALVLPRKRTGRLLLSTVLNPRILLIAPKLVPLVAAMVAQRQAAARARAGAVAPTVVGGAACPTGIPAHQAADNGAETWPPVAAAVASDLGQPRSSAPYNGTPH